MVAVGVGMRRPAPRAGGWVQDLGRSRAGSLQGPPERAASIPPAPAILPAQAILPAHAIPPAPAILPASAIPLAPAIPSAPIPRGIGLAGGAAGGCAWAGLSHVDRRYVVVVGFAPLVIQGEDAVDRRAGLHHDHLDVVLPHGVLPAGGGAGDRQVGVEDARVEEGIGAAVDEVAVMRRILPEEIAAPGIGIEDAGRKPVRGEIL